MWYKLCLLWNILLILNISARDVGDRCVPNERILDGVCKLITDCEVAVSEIQRKRFHTFERCGFQEDFEIVCCPQTTQRFGQGERKAETECKEIIKTSSNLPVQVFIIGGEVAEPGEFPHMVALGYDSGMSDGSYAFNCGGALISRTFVLTAAHCIINVQRARPRIIRAGVVELGPKTWNDQTDYVIAESIEHPEYTRTTKYHDLALLRLQTPVTISDKLNAACLYTKTSDPTGPLTITGWGKTSESQEKLSEKLLKTLVSAVSRSQCSPSYSNWRKLPFGITEGQLCAGDIQGGHDTCQGDSGGPLQFIETGNTVYRLVGVTSFGSGCGTKVPGVYTRVVNYLDWIESVVWPN